jgi:hypothetical protein
MMLTILCIFLFTTITAAHMQLWYPPPFNSSNNPHNAGPSDNELIYPYNCCGKEAVYPCNGYLSLLGTPAGAPTANWTVGSTQSWSMAGPGMHFPYCNVYLLLMVPAPLGGNHYGGSCQIGFSVDKGATFRIVVSYEGNCPLRHGGEAPSGQVFNFTVPEDIPTGEAVFAWTWINREQEFNMNCAAVSISGQENSSDTYPAAEEPILNSTDSCTPASPSASIRRGKGRCVQKRGTAFTARPEMFVPDYAGGCITPETVAELKYPDPGPDIVNGDGEYPVELPSGTC